VKNLLRVSKLLLLDMASAFVLLVVYLATKNMAVAVGFGMALGVVQIGWEFLRGKPIDTMQ
jgi:intracellular septation protein